MTFGFAAAAATPARPSPAPGLAGSLLRLGLLLALALALPLALRPAAAQVVPQSKLIGGMTFDWSSYVKYADESDNFPMTWHGNGSMFAPWGDGLGFQTANDRSKYSLGVSEIRGLPTRPDGIDVFQVGQQGKQVGSWHGKSWGIVAMASDLYMWVSPGSRIAGLHGEARLARSVNNGRTWTRARWAFTKADRVALPSFMQLGPGYTAPDLGPEITGYAYSFHPRIAQPGAKSQRPGIIDLIRVPKARMLERGAYQFFVGLDDFGAPRWSSSMAVRQPVLQKGLVSWAPPSVAYNPYLKRFLMVMPHVTTVDATSKGVAVYEAAQPWGPWAKVVETKLFAEGTGFFFSFPTKWMEADGTSMWLSFTGTDKPGGKEWDALNLLKVKLDLS